MRRVVGIDPGLSGALCVMTFLEGEDSPEIVFIPMPLIGRDLDLFELCRIFSSLLDSHVYLEQVNAFGMGASSAFKFGRGLGALEAILTAHRLPFTFVTPQRWQGVMHLGVNRNDMKDPKDRSLMVARRIFPDVNLFRTPRCKKPDEGFVDALLLCEYGRRTLRNINPQKDKAPDIL